MLGDSLNTWSPPCLASGRDGYSRLMDTFRNRRPAPRAGGSMRRSRVITNVSVATRLSLVALLVTLISLAVTSVVGLRRGNELADFLVESRLVTIGASRGNDVETYVNGVRRSVAALAVSPGAADAIEQLRAGYTELNLEPLASMESSDLTEYYLRTVVPALEAVRGTPVGVQPLLPAQPAAIRLQTAYTLPIQSEDGAASIDRALVTDAGDGSAYSEQHARLHPIYGEISIRSGFDDLFLVDASNDTIVYSVRKRVDFATSLAVGPLSGSSLANLIDAVGRNPQSGSSQIVDFSAYPPRNGRPTAFVASPVLGTDQNLVGYVVAAVSTERLDNILTGAGGSIDLGETGETYVAGQDGTMRSTARPFVEQPKSFVAEPDGDATGSSGLTNRQRRRIEATGTTALVQQVNGRVLAAAEDGPGVMETVNYQGLDVLTAYRPLEISGVDWVVFTELGTSESGSALEGFARDMLFAITLFVVAVTFMAVRWADRIMAPVRIIASRIRAVRAAPGSALADTDIDAVLPPGSSDEYLALSHNIDEMLHRLGERHAEVISRSAERAALLRQFLPAAVAQRTEQGAGDVLDHVETATVVVLALRGLGRLASELAEQDIRDLLAGLVDELDGLAAEYGLERIKVTGDSYVAVCGVSRPFLDHAARSVAFAVTARDAIPEISSELGQSLDLSIGVDSGAVSVGLTGRGGLVYDAWGAAVTGASGLARRSQPNEVSVSARVRDQLPPEFQLAEESGDGSVVVEARRAVSSEASP
jgi:class 3 adenylate cyclase